jgi:hypothetical protein
MDPTCVENEAATTWQPPRGNANIPGALTGMTRIFQRPVIIALMVAVLSTIALGIHLVLSHRTSKSSPPGTTFNTVRDAGAQMAPTQPLSPLEPPRVDPAPSAPK